MLASFDYYLSARAGGFIFVLLVCCRLALLVRKHGDVSITLMLPSIMFRQPRQMGRLVCVNLSSFLRPCIDKHEKV